MKKEKNIFKHKNRLRRIGLYGETHEKNCSFYHFASFGCGGLRVGVRQTRGNDPCFRRRRRRLKTRQYYPASAQIVGVNSLYFPLYSGKVLVHIFVPACLWLIFVSEGAASFCIIYAAAALHECGHAFFIYACRQKICRVLLLPFGALIQYTTEKLGYRGEMAIVSGGILSNLLFAFLGSLFLLRFQNEYLFLFVLSSLFFALVNLVPLRQNDGGRLLYLSVSSRRGVEHAEKALKAASLFGAALLLALGAFLLYLSGYNNGLCIFLLLAAIPK